ncbi:Cas9 inhibitor AcrIIA9 family protein [Enterococcus wangshanyuanii]|uniref:PcfK-like protein n=1 Tax=Enterococcus wangshanyuanii TaxID=2005703 RepID=A0ABQ1PR77_9ENTE|nr:Cas9 inhibitor AcrIIA9 family protein [Enterococcus wangshanyuanii]GGD01953.1 hypothetical protein GCM10011573_34330 [Enterococcus wangshanyuanii]
MIVPVITNSEVKNQALRKMLDEMNKSHSANEDMIHNWLCNQDDDQLFSGIVKEGKSINKAFKYCRNQAQKLKEDNCAMVDDSTVFGWVRDYFLLEEDHKAQASETSKIRKKSEGTKSNVKTNKSEGVQMDLFDCL